ncbi:SDR family oxidoreductase [Blastococcus sp. TF02A-26]|uniref:SDR family oxidoreductase n=1 Tax=Blastococcus sp. TF02A-26 TaxID=2250577 RepID=UPI000DE96D14|nr:SDR family oxidoreductase [Blastococcus sp. TF02A-26]RBY90842.1 NAD(P)-dependent oxidoreductase [Blastococcus sp. TF02A-26]
MSIVVTGATGHLGRLVVEELLTRGVPAEEVVAGGRRVEELTGLAGRGVRVARIDYDDPATLDAALGTGDRLLLVSGSEPGARLQQHRNVLDAATRAGVALLGYTSILRADDSPLALAEDHRQTEADIRASGLPAVLLRNGWYTENYAQALQEAQATGSISASAGDGRVASATRADYAAAAAAVLAGEGHEGAVYELSGDTAWTIDELAAAAAEVLGREVSHRRLTTDEHVATLTGVGLDEPTARFVAGMDAAIAQGALDSTTGDLSRLAGRPTTPLVEALRQLA